MVKKDSDLKNNQDDLVYGYHAVKMLLSKNPAQIKKIITATTRDDQRINTLIECAAAISIPVHHESITVLEQLTGETNHQGVAALVTTTPLYDESYLQTLFKNHDNPVLLLILDGIQDPHNLGACLRSASAMGVDAVIIPKNRAAPINATVRKVACGGAEITPTIRVTNLSRTLQWLKKEHIWIIGTDAAAATPLTHINMQGDIAIVMGNEQQGLRALTRKQCDFLAAIPINHAIASLNVSVATGILLYEVIRQRKQ